ncbi:MAG: SPOR domain-containing protein [Bacteroidia bacterium]|nr:SPOR domain-containing protein [Bacteroidia bacterium]
MSIIEKHISELLYDHDCVIVPSLGGFLASGLPSGLNSVKQVVVPPSRSIAFNVYLKQNDGLLANQIVALEHISYAEALSRIEQYVSTAYSTMRNGKKLVIERVGSLFYDAEKNLQFEPFRQVNYLKDAFGFSPVHLVPIDRDSSSAQEGRIRKISSPRPFAKPEGVSRSINRKNIQKYLGLILIAGAVSWLSINLFVISPDRFGLGTLNPFDSVIHSKTELQKNPAKTTQKEFPVTERKPDTVFVKSTTPEVQDSGSEFAMNTTAKPETPVENVPVHTTGEQKNFHVIAGVFRVQENATSLLRTLQSRGFTNAEIIPSGDLNYVCFDSFSSRRDAVTLLDSLFRSKDSGWIWRHGKPL